jgi:putative ATPase
MRPRSLDEFVGQRELVGPGRPLRELIETGQVPSLILWGPPGSGKTTLAGLLANRCNATFVPFSAVTEGIPRVRQVIAEARERRLAADRGTVLFVDEIHRFNRAQQDALLPHVERGTVTLIGATILSRTRVLVLDPLSSEELEEICRRALADTERGLGESAPSIAGEALKRITIEADGDARRALNALETAAAMSGEDEIQVSHVEAALQKRFARYDKSGEEHYNLISALHKAVRGSDPDGALYWLSRMLEAGEDPMYIARRLVRMASEDIGLADPAALSVCVAARDAYHFLGSPEGELALAQATAYLAMVPKSNAVYRAFGAASEAARETPAEGVPLHLRNAPTRLMRDLGYGRDYLYDHSYEEGVAPQTYLPEQLSGRRFYTPSDRGWEAEAGQRLDQVDTARHGEAGRVERAAPPEETDGASRGAGEASRGGDR